MRSARPMSRSSAPTSSSPAIWSPTAPTRSPSSCPTITSSWSRIRSSIDAANVKIDVVNYIPTEDRSTAMKRFEAGELDIERRHPDRAARRSQGEVRRSDQDRALSRHLLLRLQDPTRRRGTTSKLRHAISMAIDRDYLAEKVWQNTMIPAYSFVPPGIGGYETKTTDYAEMSQIDREDEAKKILDRAGLRPGQAAEDGDPLQHLGEPQEHRRGDPGAVEAARHRGDAAQHRHQDPLRPSRAARRLRRRPRRLDRRLQGSGELPGPLQDRNRQQLRRILQPGV